MSITSYTQTRDGNMTIVTVTSDLSSPVFYHWYQNGAFVGSGNQASWTFFLDDGEQARVECHDTNDADYDPIANAPTLRAARRTLEWIRSTAADIDHYRIDQKIGDGDYEQIAMVNARAGIWSYTYQTDRLSDLTSYTWKITPVDNAGNDGAALVFDQERVVRTPDAPSYTVAPDEETPPHVTFTAA